MKSEQKLYDPSEQYDEQLEEEEFVRFESKLADRHERREQKKDDELKKQKEISEIKLTKQEKKDVKKKAEKIQKYYTYDLWNHLFDKVSYYNELGGQALFHVLLGQLMSHFKIYKKSGRYIDWRVHFFWIQNSRSGKGEGVSFMIRAAKKLEKLKRVNGTWMMQTIDIFKGGTSTDAAWVNDYDMIIKKGRRVVNMKDGKPVIKAGIIEVKDIVYFEEARTFLEPGQHKKELPEICMTAMEPIGSLKNRWTKKLKDYDLEVPTESSSSFIFTTRPLQNFKGYIAYSGLFQRCMVVIREVDTNLRKLMNKKDAVSSVAIDGEIEDFERNFEELLVEIRKIVEFAHKNQIGFNQDEAEQLQAYLIEKVEWFEKYLDDNVTNQEHKSILETFVGGYKNQILIIAHHAAVMRMSNEVGLEDIEYAFQFVKETFYELVKWISITIRPEREIKEENIELKKYISSLLKIRSPRGKNDIARHLAKKFDWTIPGAYYHINKLLEGKFSFLESSEDKSVFLRKDDISPESYKENPELE